MTQGKFFTYDPDTQTLAVKGEWDIKHYTQLKTDFKDLSLPTDGELIIDGAGITKLDSAGALFFYKELLQEQRRIKFINFSDEYHKLIDLIKSKMQTEAQPPKKIQLNPIAVFGKIIEKMQLHLRSYLSFIGRLTSEVIRIMPSFPRYRWAPLSRAIYDTGYTALPIIALLSFMIGIVIAYQLGLQLKNYGANVYIVDILGVSILREFSPLITSIMVAGRTGSAFTAQLGIMKINQEIDALNTMGVTPSEILLIPRIIGLSIALPLLVMWANIFGVIGGMVMTSSMMNMTWTDFLARFQHVITIKHLIIGLGKAPLFALIIASIGCFQGMNVKGSAESIGQNTTRSVVLAIFFIIITDAILSIIFSKLRL